MTSTTRFTVAVGTAMAPNRAKRGVAMPKTLLCTSTAAPPTAVGCSARSSRMYGARAAPVHVLRSDATDAAAVKPGALALVVGDRSTGTRSADDASEGARLYGSGVGGFDGRSGCFAALQHREIRRGITSCERGGNDAAIRKGHLNFFVAA